MADRTQRSLPIRPARIAGMVLLTSIAVPPTLGAEPTPPARTDRHRESAPITPNNFAGSDVERINRAIAAALATGRRAVIPRLNRRKDGDRQVWLLDSAILLRSGLLLELENCHLKLSDSCRDNFMRSANCGLGVTDIQPMTDIHIRGRGRTLLEGADHPRATGDSAKTLGKRTYGTDAGVAGRSQTGDWRNVGILLAFVERFSIEGLRIKNSHCWAVSLERCGTGRVRDLHFDSSGSRTIDGKRRTVLNQDGLNLRQGCHDITIENITGHTGDDLVAFTAIAQASKQAGTTRSTMVSAANNRGRGRDDIRNVSLRNVRGYSKGGHHILRLLNTSGLKIHDVLIDGLIDTSGTGTRCHAAVKIGDNNPAWGGVTPLGDTHRLLINHVVSRSRNTILIAGSLSESIITNVIKHDGPGNPITYQSGPQHTRNLHTTNIHNLTK